MKNLWKKLAPQRILCTTCHVDGIHGPPPSSLKRVAKWKVGDLYKCGFCGRSWFQTEDKKRIASIQERLLPLAAYWNQTPLVVEDEVLEQVVQIGGTLNPYYEYIGVPCRVENSSGQVHDKALVMFGKQPPHFWYKPESVHWANEVKSITPSPFALPWDIRTATAEAEEISMGFAPIGIIDPEGNEFTLSWKSQFYDWKGFRGPDIRLSGRQERWKKTVSPIPVKEYYFVDWFDGCEAFLVPQG